MIFISVAALLCILSHCSSSWLWTEVPCCSKGLSVHIPWDMAHVRVTHLAAEESKQTMSSVMKIGSKGCQKLTGLNSSTLRHGYTENRMPFTADCGAVKHCLLLPEVSTGKLPRTHSPSLELSLVAVSDPAIVVWWPKKPWSMDILWIQLPGQVQS